MEQTLTSMGLSAVFALLGFVLLFVGYRAFDALVPADLNKRIFDDGNIAAAMVVAAFVIGLALIVANAIS